MEARMSEVRRYADGRVVVLGGRGPVRLLAQDPRARAAAAVALRPELPPNAPQKKVDELVDRVLAAIDDAARGR
jgi:hypothetical protein